MIKLKGVEWFGSEGGWEKGFDLREGVFGFFEVLLEGVFLLDVEFLFVNEGVELIKVL